MSETQDDPLFITAFTHPSKKQSIQKFIHPQPTPEDIHIHDLIRKCEQLTAQCKEINVNECLSQYRGVSRKYRQLRIGIESEIKKVEGCTRIDLDYMKKVFRNEPKMGYQFLKAKLDGQELELSEIREKAEKLQFKMINLENQLG